MSQQPENAFDLSMSNSSAAAAAAAANSDDVLDLSRKMSPTRQQTATSDYASAVELSPSSMSDASYSTAASSASAMNAAVAALQNQQLGGDSVAQHSVSYPSPNDSNHDVKPTFPNVYAPPMPPMPMVPTVPPAMLPYINAIFMMQNYQMPTEPQQSLAIAAATAAAAAAAAAQQQQQHQHEQPPTAAAVPTIGSPAEYSSSKTEAASGGRSSASSELRPFKQLPRDPQHIAASLVAADVQHLGEAAGYEDYRASMIEKIRRNNNGQRVPSNPRMRRSIATTHELHHEASDGDVVSAPRHSLDTHLETTVNGIKKDSDYLTKRAKNNAAAKKSRDRRREKEEELVINKQYMMNMMKKLMHNNKMLTEQLLANNIPPCVQLIDSD